MELVRSLGFIPVVNPSSDIKPLNLLIKSKRDEVQSLNAHLSDLFFSEEKAVPIINENIIIAAIMHGKEEIKDKLGSDFSFGKKVLSWLNKNVESNLSFSDENAIQIEINKALKDTVNIFSLASYIQSSLLNDLPINIHEQLVNGELYIITETLKSNDFNISFEKINSKNISADVDATVVNAQINLNLDNNTMREIKYSGSEFLVLGVKAYRIFCENEFSKSSENNFRIEIQKSSVVFKEDDFQGQLLIANQI